MCLYTCDTCRFSGYFMFCTDVEQLCDVKSSSSREERCFPLVDIYRYCTKREHFKLEQQRHRVDKLYIVSSQMTND